MRARLHALPRSCEKCLLSNEVDWAGQDSNLRLEDQESGFAGCNELHETETTVFANAFDMSSADRRVTETTSSAIDVAGAGCVYDV